MKAKRGFYLMVSMTKAMKFSASSRVALSVLMIIRWKLAKITLQPSSFKRYKSWKKFFFISLWIKRWSKGSYNLASAGEEIHL
jgi:hypothetical protein